MHFYIWYDKVKCQRVFSTRAPQLDDVSVERDTATDLSTPTDNIHALRCYTYDGERKAARLIVGLLFVPGSCDVAALLYSDAELSGANAVIHYAQLHEAWATAVHSDS
jgi:hypothetical protein